MYQYLIKLQDMLSAPVMQMAARVNRAFGDMDKMQKRVGGGMQRSWQSVQKAFGGATGEAQKLRREIASLNAMRNFHMKVDSSEYVEAGKKIDMLSAKLKALNGQSVGGGGFGGRGLLKAGGLMAAMGGGLPGLLMSGGVYGAAAYGATSMAQQAISSTVSPAMTRQMQEFQLGFQLGDQSAGKQLSEQIKNLSVANPFLKSQEAFQITPALLTAGFKGAEIPEKLNMLTNLATLSGRSIEDLAFQYKQIKQNGIAQQEELGQMADKLPIYAELIKLTGATDVIALKKMITDGKITFDMVDKAMGNIRGAKDFGQRASDGNMSMARFNVLSDQFQEKLIGLGMGALPLVNKALEYTSIFLDRIAPLGEPILKLVSSISPLIEGFGSILQALGILDSKMVVSTGYISVLANIIELLSIPIKGLSMLIRDLIGLFAGDGLFSKVLRNTMLGSVMPGFGILSEFFKGGKKPNTPSQSVVGTDDLGNYYANREGASMGAGKGGGLGKGAGAGSLGDAAGLNATVEGARKQTTIINIGKFQDKIELHVANMTEGVQMAESQLIEMLLRVANSAAAVS